MDYGKLTKKELIEMCEEKSVAYSSSWTKEQLENSLIESENSAAQNSTTVKVETSGMRRAGTIINIVFASIALVPYVLLSFLIIGIPFLIGAICAIVSNVRYKNGKDNKVMAGVLGLIFAGVIGGILVLASE